MGISQKTILTDQLHQDFFSPPVIPSSYVLKQDVNPHILHFLCNSKEHLINLPLLSTSFLKWQSIKCWAMTVAVLQPVSCWLASQTCRYSFRQVAEAAYLMQNNRIGSSRPPCSAYYHFVWVSSLFSHIFLIGLSSWESVGSFLR